MNTETPPPLSNLECIAILTSFHLLARLDETQRRALLRAVHALARREMQKERNRRAKESRKGAFFAPQEVAEAVLANPPFDPTPAPEANTATETEAANE